MYLITSSAFAQEQIVKIGHVGPLSGPIAHLGKDNENGARMAIDVLNAKGMTLGGKKVKFQLVAEDDGANPQQATSVAQKLTDAKVSGVIGHLNSGTTIPASKIYHDHGIPQISPSATNPKYTQQGYKGTFRVVANDGQLGGALGRYAANTLKTSSPRQRRPPVSISLDANTPTIKPLTSMPFSQRSKASNPIWSSSAAWMQSVAPCCAR